MDHRGKFSVTGLFQLCEQIHLNNFYDRIAFKINDFIRSDKNEIIIEGWLLPFFKDELKKFYREQIKFYDIQVFHYNCYLDGFVFVNKNESDIKINIVEPIKKYING